MAEIQFNNETSIRTTVSSEPTVQVKLASAKKLNTSVKNLNYIPAYKEYEEERQANELERIAYYELIQQKVKNGEFNGEPGKSIEFNWEGTQLGLRQEGDIDYSYTDLKGEPGETTEIESLTNLEIENLINNNVL